MLHDKIFISPTVFLSEWGVTSPELNSGEPVVCWKFRVSPTPKAHYHQLSFLTDICQSWLVLFIVYNCGIISSPIKTKGFSRLNKHTHSDTHLITACVTAPAQCTMELCWHGPAGGMGRSEIYDCADVNDIIQILNQAARFQPCRSSPPPPAWKTWHGFLLWSWVTVSDWSGADCSDRKCQVKLVLAASVWPAVRLCVHPSVGLFIITLHASRGFPPHPCLCVCVYKTNSTMHGKIFSKLVGILLGRVSHED